MRVLVTGSRDWDNVEIVEGALSVAIYQNVPAVIVHGACPSGADAIASRWTQRFQALGLTEELHPARWQWHGKAAGARRNIEMVELGANVCLAFIKNNSKGASHCARLAMAAGIDTRIWRA